MKILIVEDDKKIAEFLKKGLSEEGYQIDIADNGNDGEELASIYEYSVILLDLMLPGKNGLLVCKSLRTKEVTTPIIMLTAKDSLDDKIVGLDYGADDYLTKPFSFDELLARIRAQIRRSSKLTSNVLKIKDLELDLVSRMAKRGDSIFELTTKEFSLLEYLIRNSGRIVNERMIMENVWNIDFDTQSNIVNVYMHHLRKKIDGPEFDEKIIKTVRNKGYVISKDND